MKELVFLPDRDGQDSIGGTTGFVRIGAAAEELQALADRLAAPGRRGAAMDAAAWRSALTLALLVDVWADCGTALSVLTVDAQASPFAAWVLAARPEAEREKPVHLLLMERNGSKRLLGLADAACGVKLPAAPIDLRAVLPERAMWIDRETGEIADPVPFLSERDRMIVLGRMAALGLASAEADAYRTALEQADAAETEAVRQQDEAALERLAVRAEAVCGLTDFEAFSVRREAYACEGDNALLRCLNAETDDVHAELGDGRTYLWRGVPFAKTSSAIGLTGTMHPGAEAALNEMMGELSIMSGSSVKWNYTTGMALRRWLDERKQSAAFLPQARERIEASCRLLQDNGRQVQSAVTLTWPWDASSGAVRAILRETLGSSWMKAAAAPFADRLTKLTGHVLGDTVQQVCCACADGVLLPPLSQEMAACVAAAGTESGLAPDALRFQPQEDGGLTASFLLRGAGEVQMVRSYSADEIVVLSEAEAPSVAVWPCLPMDGWRAYHVFVQGGAEVAALCEGEWVSIQAEECAEAEAEQAAQHPRVWRCLHTTEYPGCLAVRKDGLCLGALPNMLPAYRTETKGAAVVGVDLGSSQTAVAFAFGGVPQVIEGQETTRLLVMPQEMGEDGFLGSLTPASAVPTAVAVTGDGDTLFTDGHAYRPDSMEELARRDAQTLRMALKLRSDPESVRARRLLMHQVMLGAALTARMAGAESLAWRLTIADEMGDEGREALLDMMNGLSAEVAEETGLPLTQGTPAVTWAEESAALCACLRTEGTGRGSCVAVDLGGGSTKMHLWMQSQPKPTAGAVVLEGVQDALLDALIRQPRLLLEDFGDCGDEPLLRAMLTLVDQLNPDYHSARQRDKLGLMLSELLDHHRQAAVRHLNARAAAQQPTHMQAILLEAEAAVLYTVGLMLAQVGDDVMLNHRLPEDITVCLTGRGAWLLETLTPAMRNSLQHLTHAPMRLDHPVRFVTLRAAAQPVQSVALGLTVTREVQRLSEAPQIRTRESFSGLMQRLMQQLVAAFPAHMWLLHEGMFDWQTGVLTQAGAETIRRTAARCYDDGEDIPASVMTFVRMLREVPMMPDAAL